MPFGIFDARAHLGAICWLLCISLRRAALLLCLYSTIETRAIMNAALFCSLVARMCSTVPRSCDIGHAC
jgi:hypothetical protein